MCFKHHLSSDSVFCQFIHLFYYSYSKKTRQRHFFNVVSQAAFNLFFIHMLLCCYVKLCYVDDLIILLKINKKYSFFPCWLF